MSTKKRGGREITWEKIHLEQVKEYWEKRYCKELFSLKKGVRK